MPTLLLVRHAETDYVGRGLAGRLPGVGLTERGQRQAEALAERLTSLPPTPLTALVSSPLDRALQTAAPVSLATGLPVEVAEELTEIDCGDWAGRSFAELEDDSAWRAYNGFRSTIAIPGGESLIGVQARAVGLVEQLRQRHAGGTVALFSHADVLRALLTHFLGMPLDHLLRLEVAPASISVVQVEVWGAQVLTMNDTGRLGG